jgi:hypothetical protein
MSDGSPNRFSMQEGRHGMPQFMAILRNEAGHDSLAYRRVRAQLRGGASGATQALTKAPAQ